MCRVAYTDSAQGAGTDIDLAISFWPYDVDDKYVLLPDDVITEEEYMTGAFNGYVFREDVIGNSFITRSMLCPQDTDELFDNTTREITVNSIEVPANITEGDYVDIRFRVSSSELQMALTDEIVLAKKEIIAKEGTSIILRLSEKEQMLLAAAAIENTITPTLPYTDGFKKTTMLYATKYVSITQPAAEVTYSNDALLAVVRDNWSGDYYHAVVDNVPAAEEAVSQETLVDAEPVVVGNGD